MDVQRSLSDLPRSEDGSAAVKDAAGESPSEQQATITCDDAKRTRVGARHTRGGACRMQPEDAARPNWMLRLLSRFEPQHRRAAAAPQTRGTASRLLHASGAGLAVMMRQPARRAFAHAPGVGGRAPPEARDAALAMWAKRPHIHPSDLDRRPGRPPPAASACGRGELTGLTFWEQYSECDQSRHRLFGSYVA